MSRICTVLTAGVCCLAGVVPLMGDAAPADGDTPLVTSPQVQSPPPRNGTLSAREVLELLRQPGDDDFAPPPDDLADTPERKSRRVAVAWYMAGQVHEARNELDKAAKAYEQAVEAAPGELPPYQSLLSIAFAQGKRDEAVRYALAAVKHNERGLQLVRGLAALLVRAGATSEGIDLLKQVLEQGRFDSGTPSDLLLHRDLGVYYRLSGKSQESAENFGVVFNALQNSQQFPLSEQNRIDLVGDSGETYEEMGEVFLDAKQPDLAVKAFEQAAQFSQSRPGLHSFNLATVYRQTGRPQEALDELQGYFDAQLQLKGRAAYQLLKELLDELGRSEELVSRLNTLLEKDELNKALRYFVADQYVQAGDLDKAEKLLEDTSGASTDPRGLVGLAAVYQQQGRTDKLLEALAKAFASIPQTEEEEMLERLAPDVRALIEQFGELEESIAEDAPTMNHLLALGREKSAVPSRRRSTLCRHTCLASWR